MASSLLFEEYIVCFVLFYGSIHFRVKRFFMDKMTGKLLLMPALFIAFTGCAQAKENLLREGKRGYSDLQNSVIDLTKKLDELNEKIASLSENKNGRLFIADNEQKVPLEKVEFEGLEVVEAAEQGGINVPAPLPDIDILESPGDDKTIGEIVKVGYFPLAGDRTSPLYRRNLSPKEHYRKAYKMYKQGDLKNAIAEFTSFIAEHPVTNYTDNAFYWRGECYYSMGEFMKALKEFDEVINKFPKSNKAPDAILKRGFSYIKLRNSSKAKEALQEVMDLYPFSVAAKKAAEKINSL